MGSKTRDRAVPRGVGKEDLQKDGGSLPSPSSLHAQRGDPRSTEVMVHCSLKTTFSKMVKSGCHQPLNPQTHVLSPQPFILGRALIPEALHTLLSVGQNLGIFFFTVRASWLWKTLTITGAQVACRFLWTILYEQIQ